MGELPRGARGPRVNYRMIRLCRLERGLTQADVSKRLQVDQGNLSRIETGKVQYPSIATTKALAAVLGVPMWTLLAPTTSEVE